MSGILRNNYIHLSCVYNNIYTHIHTVHTYKEYKLIIMKERKLMEIKTPLTIPIYILHENLKQKDNFQTDQNDLSVLVQSVKKVLNQLIRYQT